MPLFEDLQPKMKDSRVNVVEQLSCELLKVQEFPLLPGLPAAFPDKLRKPKLLKLYYEKIY